MAEIQEESLQELDRAVAEVRDFMRNRAGIRGGNNQMTMHVNAGGVGVWIAVTCCIVMLSCLTVGGILANAWLNSEFANIHSDLKDRRDENESMKAYLAAIYMQAPQLKPKEKEQNHGN